MSFHCNSLSFVYQGLCGPKLALHVAPLQSGFVCKGPREDWM